MSQPGEERSQPLRKSAKGKASTKGKGRAAAKPGARSSQPSGSHDPTPNAPLPAGWGDRGIHYNTDSASDSEDLGVDVENFGRVMRLGKPSFDIQAISPIEAAAATGADELSDRAPPSTRDPSPVRDDFHQWRQEETSSSASSASRLSKRRRQPSPPGPRARPRYDQNTREPWLAPPLPERTSFLLDPRVQALEAELDRAQRHIASLEGAQQREFHRGYNEGFGAGWQRAVEAERNRPYTPPPRHDRDLEDRYTGDLRQAMAESRQAYRPREPQSSGAGPSRSRSSGSGADQPLRRSLPAVRRVEQQRAPRPRAPPREIPPELAVPARREPSLASWPDPARLTDDLRHTECLPIPPGRKWRADDTITALISTTGTPERVADATTYDEFWLAIALRRGNANVPEVFTRLHVHRPHLMDAYLCRQAAMGYVHSRQIAAATRWDRHMVAAFIVIMAVFAQGRFVSERMWKRVRYDDIIMHRQDHEGAELPDNNWRALLPFASAPHSQGPSLGLMMTPPPDPAMPWHVHTRWPANEIVMLLRSARITCSAMLQLFAYADLFIRSRMANGPIWGVNYDNAGRDIYPAPFITATGDAISPMAREATTSPAATMDVDEANTSRTAPPPPPHPT
jgi:hypothetical protein